MVLRTMRLGEADRIVTLAGRHHGRIRAVAKGVRKTKSRFGGRLEPFSHVSLVLWRGKSDLDTVTQAEVIEPYRSVREDLDRFSLGEVMLEASDRVIQQCEPCARVLNLLLGSLGSLASSPSPLVLARFLLKLSSVAGFAPCLDRCADCGAPAAWFSPGQGGAVCPGCRAYDAEETGPGPLELLSDLAGAGWDAARQPAYHEVALVCRLARCYTEYHLERRLKSAAAADVLARL